MSTISDLRRAAAMAAIREQIDQCELGALGAYLVSLVEADWEDAEPAENTPCDATQLWSEEFNGGKPYAPATAEPQPIVEVALVAKPADTPPPLPRTGTRLRLI